MLFPLPKDHILLELSTMTPLSQVALNSTAHNFIELDKPEIHGLNCPAACRILDLQSGVKPVSYRVPLILVLIILLEFQ